ncbi:hypothetical protein F4804DRAFT_314112 [Jackrogersella minutella]|nr:hypothetical protein F4804DRAFT_314112 [Jackrogersella minutella]
MATECQGIASDIIVLLDRCKSKTPHSKGSTLKATSRSLRYKGDLQSLQVNLERHQQLLHLGLTTSIRYIN